MNNLETERRFSPEYLPLCDGRFAIWDRGDEIAEITAEHGIIAFVKADPLRGCDWENSDEPVTAFPGHIRVEFGLKLPNGTDTFIESVEHLERILSTCEIIPPLR